MAEKTHFPVNIQELKQKAKEYTDAGTPFKYHAYGNSIEKYLENNLGQFHMELFRNDTLPEYIWFYCFKAALYEQSYKHETNDGVPLLDFQANELTYHTIFSEIENDALNHISYENNNAN